MKELTEGAFAKVNLTLDVLDKREDGYHNLRSIMQTVSLHDDVHVTVGCEGWQIHCYREVLPPDADENTEPELVTCGLPQDRENLAWKAAEAFYARIGKKPEGLEIFINKRIPLEAGLGGGSADAAAVLRALNRAYDSPLSIPALCELGAQVGSDVPFCVMGGTALVEGKGELLTRLPPAPEFFVVICKPDFSVSTPELYQALDETFIEKRPDQKVMQLNLQKGDLLGIGGSLCNVFEPVVMQKHFDINYIRSMMYTYGAYGAQMTGSGSAVFGIYDSFEYATVACTMLKDKYSQIFLAKTVYINKIPSKLSVKSSLDGVFYEKTDHFSCVVGHQRTYRDGLRRFAGAEPAHGGKDHPPARRGKFRLRRGSGREALRARRGAA